MTNYSTSVPGAFRFTQPSTALHNATFCNVTVSYTHPGLRGNVLVEAWLPVDNWNGRFAAVGGGGWAAGRFSLSWTATEGAMADGYATVTTDTGLGGAPGLGHCFGGPSGQPSGLFEQLRAWVENGTAPEHAKVELTGPGGELQHRIVCPYPRRPSFSNSCGEAAVETCWPCVSPLSRSSPSP